MHNFILQHSRESLALETFYCINNALVKFTVRRIYNYLGCCYGEDCPKISGAGCYNKLAGNVLNSLLVNDRDGSSGYYLNWKAFDASISRYGHNLSFLFIAE